MQRDQRPNEDEGSEYGEGHVIITLGTIVESSGNECALTAPAVYVVIDLVLAHPL